MAKKKKTVKKMQKKIQKKTTKEIKENLSKLSFCPACASDNVFYSEIRDELICRDCGEIFSKVKL